MDFLGVANDYLLVDAHEQRLDLLPLIDDKVALLQPQLQLLLRFLAVLPKPLSQVFCVLLDSLLLYGNVLLQLFV